MTLLDPMTWLVAVLALAGILAALLLLARGARAFGLAPATGRRLAVQEQLPLDSRRRLLLLRCDGRELLVITGAGGDTLLGWLPGEAAP
jgi:flagellar protein FliO/FliZ